MKKIGFMLLMIVVILILIILLFFGTSGKRTDVFLQDYQVSEDGKRMKIKVSVSSSMGYIRDLKVKQDGDNQCITFYSTFGLNNKFGAKNEFEIDLNPNCEEIYFYRGNEEYELVLRKDSEWRFNEE